MISENTGHNLLLIVPVIKTKSQSTCLCLSSLYHLGEKLYPNLYHDKLDFVRYNSLMYLKNFHICTLRSEGAKKWNITSLQGTKKYRKENVETYKYQDPEKHSLPKKSKHRDLNFFQKNYRNENWNIKIWRRKNYGLKRKKSRYIQNIKTNEIRNVGHSKRQGSWYTNHRDYLAQLSFIFTSVV